MKNKYMKRVFLYMAVFIFLLVCVAPFTWVFIGSLHTDAEIFRGEIDLIPRNPTIENYIPLLTPQPGAPAIRRFYLFVGNSLVVGIGTAFMTAIIAALGAYGLSRFNFPGRDTLGKLLLFVYVFPVVLIVIPVHGLLARVGLLDTRIGVMLVHVALAAPFCAWLLRSFFDSIPRALEEAAAVDGAGRLRMLFHIILPLSAPGIATAGIFAFVGSWGEYLFSSLLITSGARRTIPVGLSMYMADQFIEWGMLLAGAVLIFIPLLVIFMPVSKLFLRGFLEGAVK